MSELNELLREIKIRDKRRGEWIPKIDDIALAKLYRRIKPVVRNKDGKMCYIKNVDLRNTAYTWSPTITRKVKIELEPYGDITTYHTYGYKGFFKPSIAEVIAQIPPRYIRDTVAFEIIASPETVDDLNRESEATNAGYHVATTRLYKKSKVV